MAPAPGLRMFVCPNSLDIPDWPLARISACEVDVFSVSTHFSLSDIGQLRTLLTDDELSRADRFRFDEHRNQYTIARGWLRLLLSGYTGRDATQLRFAYASNGKPELVSDTGEASIDFNVAHSEELIVLAFARHRRLGIDIERIRQDVAYDDLAQRYFSAAEYACLRELAPTRRA
ncbi:MAG: hypothetical protein JOZ36_11935, partial [Acidobacteria bacterium]|nr:hypothetical protein [Acidobacteriota bacterium]